MSNHPHVNEFKIYFKELYKHGDINDIVNLSSHVYIPILDDPINPNEVL